MAADGYQALQNDRNLRGRLCRRARNKTLSPAGLSISVDKCSSIAFHRSNCTIAFNYCISGTQLQPHSAAKDLGVTFDGKLDFHVHRVSAPSYCSRYSIVGLEPLATRRGTAQITFMKKHRRRDRFTGPFS